MLTKTCIFENLIEITLLNPSIQYLEEWNQFIYSSLFPVVKESFSIATIDFQPYSLGFDLDNCQKVKHNNRNHLINLGIYVNNSLLSEIVESEEFRRGLLFIVFSDVLQDVIDAILNIEKDKLNELRVKTVILVGDGLNLVFAGFGRIPDFYSVIPLNIEL